MREELRTARALCRVLNPYFIPPASPAVTREFPYPFLNALPQPYGIAGTIGVSLALSFFFWHLGRTIRHFKAKETNKTL